MKKLKILVVAPYISFPCESGSNRFIFLVNLLKSKYDVTLVTSSFHHKSKTVRNFNPVIEGVKVVLIDEPGYSKNIDLKRINSHYIFCKNFVNFLDKNIFQYDLVYSAYPLIKTNYILGQLKNKYNFKFIIDVQDVWPEAITGAIPILSSTLGSYLLKPVSYYANRTYSYADALIAVSKTYLNRANVNHLPEDLAKAVYIGANGVPLINYQNNNDKVRAVYLGTLGESYDLETIIRAAAICRDNAEFIIVGTGPKEDYLKKLNQQLGGYVKFLGSLKYSDAIEVVKSSDIALNAIKDSAQQSITNKLSDYFYCNKPIFSSQTNKEVMELLSRGGGINYLAGDYEELARLVLSTNKDQLQRMSEVNRLIYKESFYRPESYKAILQLIEELI